MLVNQRVVPVQEDFPDRLKALSEHLENPEKPEPLFTEDELVVVNGYLQHA